MFSWLKNKSNKKWFLGLALGIIFLSLFFSFDFTFAQDDAFGIQAVEESGLQLGGGDLRITIGKIIRAVLGFLGIVAVIIVIYGGFTYMTAAGDQEKITRARKILINGTIGLAIILTSFLIVNFVIGRLSQAIGNVPPGSCDSLEDCNIDPVCPGCGFGDNCFDNVFTVKSITPNQETTGMNNIVMRGVFTQSVGTPVDQIFTIEKDGQNITGDVSFSFVETENEDHKQKVVEAVYTAKEGDGTGYCVDPSNGDCLVAGSDYKITLNENVVSINGQAIEEGEVCGGFEPPQSAEFNVDAIEDDISKPVFNYIKIVGPDGTEYEGSSIKLPAGQKYVLQAEVQDNSGIGYVHFKVSSNDGTDSLERYDGPINSDQSYLFEKTIFIGNGMPLDVVYSAVAEAFDIDHNSELASLQFSVAPAHCANGVQDEKEGETGIDFGGPCGGDEGGNCQTNIDCADGLICGPDKTCIGLPVIMDVSPSMDGAQGNWITILGKYFGTTPGLIQFALNNGDNEYQESEWVDAPLAQCGPTETWKNNYAIVEVPNGFSIGDLASIRIKTNLGQSQEDMPMVSQSAYFDGADDFVFVPHNDLLNVAEGAEITLSAWIKPENYSNRIEIMRKGHYGTNNAYSMSASFEQGKENEGRLNCYFHPSIEPGTLYQANGFTLKFGQWNHVVCRRVKNSADGKGRVEVYINGELAGQSDWRTDGLKAVENTDEFLFGGIGFGASYNVNPLQGNMDEISIFSNALTSEQISGLYDTGRHGSSVDYLNRINETGSLTAHWGFDELNGIEAKEEVQGLNGEYKNGVLLGEEGIFAGNENILYANGELFAIDQTTNDIGPKPGPREGLFEFNNIIRPGLCSVEVLEDYVATIDGVEKTFNAGSLVAPPRAPILAQGNGFGGNPELWFGANHNADVLGIITDDLGLDKITSAVPRNLEAGIVGVFVRSGGEQSNGVPFTIAKSADEVIEPDIVTIDPSQTTPGSYITLFGTGFGDVEGKVYGANSQDNVSTCGKENEHESCFELNTNNFPPQCGSNVWTDTQVIAEIPEEVREKGLFEEQEVENPNDFLSYAGFPPPRIIENDSDPVSISADLLPGYEGRYDMNADWKMDVDVELRQEPSPGDSTTYGLWSVKVFGQNRYVTLLLVDENIDGNITTRATFTFGENGESISVDSFSRISDRLTVSIDNSISNGTLSLRVRDINGVLLASNEIQAATIAQLEEGTMLLGGIPGYSVSEMVLHSFIITTFETKSGGSVNIRLERFDNQSTKGEDVLGLYDDAPLPSICKLEPMSGPAPLPEGDEGLNLYGVNFPENPVVHFWQPGAEFTNLNTWLSSETHKYKNESVIKSSSAQELTTLIPYDETTGYTMETGPIKIADPNRNDRISNFVTYVVTDCIDAEPIPGFQCCTEGQDAGRWKPENYTCAGEIKSAGYVWRFTTGLIPVLPQVVEHCDQENWSVDDEYPSPIPWQEWNQGSNTCLNSTIAVRFNMEMSKASINAGTIKVYNCGQGASPNCDIETPDTGVTDTDENGNFVNFENGDKILEIKKGTWNGENPLAENTWYRVVLYDGIVSVPQEFGVGKEESVALKKTKPLEGFDNIAYYYDFKTGTGFCTLQSVGIYPPEKTASILGQIMADYELNTPFYYLLSGKADQECTMLDVKGMGWNWATEDSEKAPDQRRAEVTEKTDDETRAGAEALLHAPEGVEIKAFAPVPEASQLQAIFPDSDSVNADPSILYISLGDPQAEYWEPECETACRNSSILVDFNRQMAIETYKDGFHLYQCMDAYDPDCKTVQEIADIVEEDFADSSDRQLVFIPSFLFDSNTRYRVELTDEIKALERLEPPLYGKGLIPHSWYFKIQDNEEPCQPAKLELTPNPFVARMIGEKTKYTALPRQNPDECSKYGQILNPNNYDYNWSTDAENVVEITNYKLGHAIAPYCTDACLKRGSDIYSTVDVQKLYLCGNGVLDPGEDCDIAIAPGKFETACSLNCLRPGNTIIGDGAGNCGNGVVDGFNGEQCDPEDPNTGSYCNPDNCLLIGAEAQTEIGACGDGSWTYNEACDRGLTLENTDDPEKSRVGCNEQCLHTGTRPIASFCQNVAKPENIEICKDAMSVCGNGSLELGEECDNPESSECSTSCTLIENACGTDNQQCTANSEGCDENCILLGSSSIYSIPSVCGDSNVGIGEDEDCELESGQVQSLGAGPVQVATAVGEGQVDPETNRQTANIFAELLETSISGSANYALHCGYEEYETEDSLATYNNCPNNSKNNLGVASNSCCLERPRRIDEYPKDLTGLSGDVPICPNTQISATFDHEINQNSLFDNITIVKGFEAEVDCVGADVTEKVNGALALDDLQNKNPSFLKKIWINIKEFFARLFGRFALAGEQKDSVSNIATWCQTNIVVNPEVHNQLLEVDGEIVVDTSTVLFNIQSILDADSIYAILLDGGKNGIRDVDGVGIKHAYSENPSIVDVWVFKTGEKTCQLDAVWIEPAGYLFQAPFSSQNFLARAISFTYEKDEGRDIVPIPGGYDWSWDWGPIDSPLFSVPANGAANSNQVSIASTDLQGELTVRAIATITNDSFGTSVGRKVIGAAQLVSKFCERPWPPITDGLENWQPYEDTKYNFRMSYCADSGLSGSENIDDDLPYLETGHEFADITESIEIDVPGACEYSQNECLADSDCDKYFEMNNDQIIISNSESICAMRDVDTPGNILYPPNYLIRTGYRTCSTDVDCQNVDGPEGENGICRSILGANLGTRLNNSCVGATTETENQIIEQVLAESTLKKVIFFNDKNEDLFGLQILTNPDRLSIREWFERRFGSSSQMQSLSIAGYEALTDGNTYYVNAMNITDTENPDSAEFHRIYNNVYLFSVNEEAQTNTREVLEQLIDSLEFNINMHDYGYCLNAGADLHANPLDYNTDYPCNNNGSDFECLDTSGLPLDPSLSGICSSARRKFDRDIERLQDIQSIQSRLELGIPNLEGGTYIPGYTVSRWPSWSREDGLNMSQYLDPLNIWTACDGESQTCWNGETLEFHCPTRMSVYEYYYNPEIRNYNLYSSLEYFRNENLIEEYFKEYITSPDSFVLGRHCVADSKYTPHVSSCGDGVIGSGEQCDPPGEYFLTEDGYTEEKFYCEFDIVQSVCASDVDCPLTILEAAGQKRSAPMVFENTGVCVTNDGDVIIKNDESGEVELFKCDKRMADLLNDSCTDPDTFGGRGATVKTWGNSAISDILVSELFVINEDPVSRITIPFLEAPNCELVENTQLFKESLQGDCPITGERTLEIGNCEGLQAESFCNDSCQINYGVCKPLSDCGNGIVEAGEFCDDGNLNGTYGHCADNCLESYSDYCGDGELQSNVEFCDWSMPNKSTWSQNQEDSCAFNCKGYGGWCGDGILQSNNEECDDGNNDDFDGCRNDCYKTRFCSYVSTEKTCLMDEECPLTDLLHNKKVTGSEDLKVCTRGETRNGFTYYYPFFKEELQNQEITPFICDIDQDCYNQATYGGFAADKSIYNLDQDGVQQVDFVGDDFFLQDLNCQPLNATDVFEDYYNVSCSEERIQIFQEEAPETVEVGCGNGIIENEETNPELNPDQWEECDFGQQNGLACTPSYGAPCTYCSESCRTIQVDPSSYCGDNKFEAEYEECDYENGIVITKQGENICIDKGEWQCLDNCQRPEGNCVECGISETGAEADLLIINPITMASLEPIPLSANTLFWEQLNDFESLESGGQVTLLRPKLNADGQASSMKYYNTIQVAYNNDNILPVGERLETDLQCREEYYVYFNRDRIEEKTGEDSLLDQYNTGLGHLFEYPVREEVTDIKNTVIYSPAVPRGAFRIIVKWTDAEHSFLGGFFAEEKMFFYSDFAPSGYCYTVEKENNYWMPACNGNVGDYLFFHSQLDRDKIHLNSFTVDTNEISNQDRLAFFVQSVGTDRIGSNINKFSDLHVEVYEYREGQDPTFSVYKPTRTYTIRNAADTSSNQVAKYWHVFNLEYVNGRYQIVEKQSIETDECQLKQSIYDPIILEWCQ